MRDEELDSLPLVLSESSSSRQGCWLLLLSLTASFTWLVPSISLLYLLIDHNSWQVLVSYCHHWLEHNHWDLMVTRTVWAAVNWVDNNNTIILITLAAVSSLNILLSLMVTVSALTNRRGLAIPWLVYNALIILVMLLTFTCWTFISFFISILLAIIFPVLAGLVLGVWILIWKKVYIFQGAAVSGVAGGRRKRNCEQIVGVKPRKGYTSVPALHNAHNHRLTHVMTRSPSQSNCYTINDQRS